MLCISNQYIHVRMKQCMFVYYTYSSCTVTAYWCLCCVFLCVSQYLRKALICSDSINLDILAFLDEPQVCIVGLIVVHVECLQNKKSVHPLSNSRNVSFRVKRTTHSKEADNMRTSIHWKILTRLS